MKAQDRIVIITMKCNNKNEILQKIENHFDCEIKKLGNPYFASDKYSRAKQKKIDVLRKRKMLYLEIIEYKPKTKKAQQIILKFNKSI